MSYRKLNQVNATPLPTSKCLGGSRRGRALIIGIASEPSRDAHAVLPGPGLHEQASTRQRRENAAGHRRAMGRRLRTRTQAEQPAISKGNRKTDERVHMWLWVGR